MSRLHSGQAPDDRVPPATIDPDERTRVLSATLAPAAAEHGFRVWDWPTTMRRARIAIITTSAVFLLFVYPDYLFFGVDWPFSGLLALRGSVVLFGFAVLALVRGEPRPRRFDVLLFVWIAWVALLTAYLLPSTRPNAWILHGFIVCAGIPAIYVLIPMTFLGGLMVGVGMAAGYMVFLVTSNPQLGPMQGGVVTVALLAANVIGAVTSRWLHQSRRETFLRQLSLTRAEDNLNTLVDEVPFPLLLVGRDDRRVRRLNDSARALLSDDATAGGESLVERIVGAAVTQVPATGDAAVEPREIPVPDREGGVRWLLMSVRPITHDGDPCALVSLIDITLRRQTEDNLARAKREADETSRAKSLFLATMSHEIRTPLHGVLGAVQLLERAGVDGRLREYVDVIRYSARGMSELVDGVLDLARAESGPARPAPLSFDARELVRALCESLRARAADAELRVDIDETLPAWVRGDEPRVRRVLLNLVDNALKYGAGSPVAIDVRVAGARGDALLVRWSVENGGPPIPAAARAAIFEPFTQLDQLGDSRRGFGLGLAICKREVAALGGELALEDTGPAGPTRFSFTIPLEAGEAPPEGAHEGEHAAPRRSLALLVAEDDSVSLRLATSLLEGTGHRISAAASGPEAVARAAAEDFDAVLMDIRLPGFDGCEATRRIRALGGPRARVPIIATTANALLDERARYFEAGVSAILPKPIDFDVLEVTLARACSPVSRAAAPLEPDALIASPPPLASEALAAPLIDRELLSRHVRALGDPRAIELIALAVDTAGPLLASILEAVAQPDHERAARLAHRLASAAHSAALTRMGDVAGALEAIARRGADAVELAGALTGLERTWRLTLEALSEWSSARAEAAGSVAQALARAS